jgi:hypothetical protein
LYRYAGCENASTEHSLIWAYFFLLVAFYIIKKLSTIGGAVQVESS